MSENRGKIPCGTYFRAIDRKAWIDVVVVCELANQMEVNGKQYSQGDYVIFHGAIPKLGWTHAEFRDRYLPIGSWAGFDAGAYNWEGPNRMEMAV